MDSKTTLTDLDKLYRENRGLLYNLARKYSRLDPAIDADDLAQIGALALPAASESFDPASGKSWLSWAAWHVKSAIRDALHIRHKDGETVLPLNITAARLDAPLSSDGSTDGLTLGDVLPDDAPPLDSGTVRNETRSAVREAAARLASPIEREALHRRAFGGATYCELAEALHVSQNQAVAIYARALDKLRHDRRLKVALTLDDVTPYFHHVGVQRFHSTSTSATEHAVLWRLEHEADKPTDASIDRRERRPK